MLAAGRERLDLSIRGSSRLLPLRGRNTTSGEVTNVSMSLTRHHSLLAGGGVKVPGVNLASALLDVTGASLLGRSGRHLVSRALPKA